MLSSRLRAGLVALVVGGAVLTGCKQRHLTELEVPDEGLTLAYDLSPGQAYGGQVRMQNTVRSPQGDIVTSVEFAVDMVVAGPQAGKHLVRATVSEISVRNRLPEGIADMFGSGLGPKAAQAVEGMELRFFVDDTGRVSDLPEPPADAPMDIKAVVGMITGAVAATFVTLPASVVRNGDSWNTATAAAPEGAKAQGKGTLLGMAHDERTGEDVARLQYEGSADAVTEQGGQSLTVASRDAATALFSRNGYVTSIERERTGEVAGMSFRMEVDGRWNKLDKRNVAPPPVEDTQVIADPCDPDYVGPEPCPERAEDDPGDLAADDPA